jgi:signal peptidase I
MGPGAYRKKPVTTAVWRRLALAGFCTLGVALGLRGVVTVYRIPSASMAPTLVAGDYLVVSRIAYGVRVPGVGVLCASLPARGDVVVLEAGEGEGRATRVKRVVGLPGDTISLRKKALWVNGSPVPREPVGEVQLDGDGAPLARGGFLFERELWEERLGERTHELTLHKGVPARDEGPWTVPDGHVFVLGDDRDDSLDSRLPAGFGPVRLDALEGRARYVLFSRDPRGGLRDGRTLTPVR